MYIIYICPCLHQIKFLPLYLCRFDMNHRVNLSNAKLYLRLVITRADVHACFPFPSSYVQSSDTLKVLYGLGGCVLLEIIDCRCAKDLVSFVAREGAIIDFIIKQQQLGETKSERIFCELINHTTKQNLSDSVEVPSHRCQTQAGKLLPGTVI